MDSTSTLQVKHNLVAIGIPMDAKRLSLGEALVQSFPQASPSDDLETSIELHARFIEHCAPRSPDIALAAFAAFNKSFCTRNSIHVVVQEHGLDANQAKAVLRGYFSAWNIASARDSVPSSVPALLSDPTVSTMAIFGGQGGMDNYLDEARDLVDVYGPLLADYPARMFAFLHRESQDPRISGCYAKGFDVARWLASPESQPDPEYLLTVPVSIPAHRLVTFGIPVDAKHLSLGEDLVQSFLQTSPGGDLKTPIEVHARFIEHCAPRSPDIALAAFAAFNNSFCTRNNIHVVVQEHGLDANQAKAVLRGYFSAWNIASARGAVPSSAPALFPDPSVSMMAIFGGQGGMDNYLDEARDLVDIYGPLLADYPARISAFLQRESQDPRISTCYAKGLDVARWLASPESQPDPEYLLTVPVSIPAVGLIQLMQVMVAFKTLGLSPGELAKSFKVATGHSQGIAIATALSQVTDEQSFYAISEK
ncbi:hypothetical protein GQ54DRAFT_314874, partial [Martensiomyces pterosporus]